MVDSPAWLTTPGGPHNGPYQEHLVKHLKTKEFYRTPGVFEKVASFQVDRMTGHVFFKYFSLNIYIISTLRSKARKQVAGRGTRTSCKYCQSTPEEILNPIDSQSSYRPRTQTVLCMHTRLSCACPPQGT
jgi:hypothetical protein